MDKLKAHKKEGNVRYNDIEKQLDRIQISVYGLYPFLVGLLLASKSLG